MENERGTMKRRCCARRFSFACFCRVIFQRFDAVGFIIIFEATVPPTTDRRRLLGTQTDSINERSPTSVRGCGVVSTRSFLQRTPPAKRPALFFAIILFHYCWSRHLLYYNLSWRSYSRLVPIAKTTVPS